MAIDNVAVPAASRPRTFSFYLVLLGLVAPLWSAVPASWVFVIHTLRSGRIGSFGCSGIFLFVLTLCEVCCTPSPLCIAPDIRRHRSSSVYINTVSPDTSPNPHHMALEIPSKFRLHSTGYLDQALQIYLRMAMTKSLIDREAQRRILSNSSMMTHAPLTSGHVYLRGFQKHLCRLSSNMKSKSGCAGQFSTQNFHLSTVYPPLAASSWTALLTCSRNALAIPFPKVPILLPRQCASRSTASILCGGP